MPNDRDWYANAQLLNRSRLGYGVHLRSSSTQPEQTKRNETIRKERSLSAVDYFPLFPRMGKGKCCCGDKKKPDATSVSGVKNKGNAGCDCCQQTDPDHPKQVASTRWAFFNVWSEIGHMICLSYCFLKAIWLGPWPLAGM